MDEYTRERLLDEKAKVEDNPAQYARARSRKIDKVLRGEGGRPPIAPRKSMKPGNISMYDHLTSLKKQYDEAAESGGLVGVVKQDVDRLESRIKRIEKASKNDSRDNDA